MAFVSPNGVVFPATIPDPIVGGTPAHCGDFIALNNGDVAAISVGSGTTLMNTSELYNSSLVLLASYTEPTSLVIGFNTTFSGVVGATNFSDRIYVSSYFIDPSSAFATTLTLHALDLSMHVVKSWVLASGPFSEFEGLLQDGANAFSVSPDETRCYWLYYNFNVIPSAGFINAHDLVNDVALGSFYTLGLITGAVSEGTPRCMRDNNVLLIVANSHSPVGTVLRLSTAGAVLNTYSFNNTQILYVTVGLDNTSFWMTSLPLVPSGSTWATPLNGTATLQEIQISNGAVLHSFTKPYDYEADHFWTYPFCIVPALNGGIIGGTLPPYTGGLPYQGNSPNDGRGGRKLLSVPRLYRTPYQTLLRSSTWKR